MSTLSDTLVTLPLIDLFSPLTLGCWSLIGDANWGDQDEKDSIAAIEAALTCGVRSFDTAPLYGNGDSERLLGRVLKPVRESVTIATKVAGTLTASAVRRSCEESLERLQTDYIDVFQIHWPDHETPFSETAAELARLQEEGKVRHVGVCNFGLNDLKMAVEYLPLRTNQMAYSLLWRGIEFEVLPFCRQHGIEIMAYSPLMQGLLSGRFAAASEVPEGRARTKHFSSVGRPQVRHGQPGHEEGTFAALAQLRKISAEAGVAMPIAALQALLSRPGVGTVLAGARNASQVQENAEVLRNPVSPSAIDRLLQATEALKNEIGAELDPWATPSRIN
jgi:myo-inositol catabolism protein IolS